MKNLWLAAGPFGALATVADRIASPRVGCWDRIETRVQDRVGLEVGGPSSRFGPGGIIPVYPVASRIDNTNFATRTLWEGQVAEEFVYHHSRKPGRQFLLDATDLGTIDDRTYDFLLSSHVLEHIANPLQALTEWRRVLRPGGSLVTIVPHGGFNFDHRRPVSSLDHIINDYENDVGEDDTTHLDEVIELHDVRRDPQLASREVLIERTRANAVHRAVHHHVFTTALVEEVLDHAGFYVVAVEFKRPYDIVALADVR